jgi:hypothetical protein
MKLFAVILVFAALAGAQVPLPYVTEVLPPQYRAPNLYRPRDQTQGLRDGIRSRRDYRLERGIAANHHGGGERAHGTCSSDEAVSAQAG